MRDIYIDTIGGDDLKGDGTVAHPFKTVNRAMMNDAVVKDDRGGLKIEARPESMRGKSGE